MCRTPTDNKLNQSSNEADSIQRENVLTHLTIWISLALICGFLAAFDSDRDTHKDNATPERDRLQRSSNIKTAFPQKRSQLLSFLKRARSPSRH